MRVNRYLAYRYGASRRQADKAIANSEVYVNGQLAELGQTLSFPQDTVVWAGHMPIKKTKFTTIALNKPVGYVCSADGQGSPTIYNLLPENFKHLKFAGRLDKDSSGLVVLSDDGELIYNLTHPSNNKTKEYVVKLNKSLTSADTREVVMGVDIGDQTPSRLQIENTSKPKTYKVQLQEGRNRQIRRSFAAINFEVLELHRLSIGDIKLGKLASGKYTQIND